MKNLCRALIWNACFLELSEDTDLEPDPAVRALEQMATILRQSTPDEKAAFIQECKSEAARLRVAGNARDSKAAAFVEDLPESLGLL